MLAYSAFTLNFLFYGGLYGFPQVLSQLGDKTSMKPAVSLIVAASFEIPGCLIGIYLGLKFKRKPALLLYLIATTFFTLFFATFLFLSMLFAALIFHFGQCV